MFEQIVVSITILILNASIWILLFTKYAKWEKVLLFAISYALLFIELVTLLKGHEVLILPLPLMMFVLKFFLLVWIPMSEKSGPKGEYRETYLRVLSNYNFVWEKIVPKVTIIGITYLQIAIIWSFKP